MARAIVNRLLHGPTARLKELQDDRVHARMAMIRDLFGLEGLEVEGGARLRPASRSRSLPRSASSDAEAFDRGRTL